MVVVKTTLRTTTQRYQVGGKIVGKADLVSSALSLHPQCTSNCGFTWYSTLQVSLCAPFCVCQNNKILTDRLGWLWASFVTDWAEKNKNNLATSVAV